MPLLNENLDENLFCFVISKNPKFPLIKIAFATYPPGEISLKIQIGRNISISFRKYESVGDSILFKMCQKSRKKHLRHTVRALRWLACPCPALALALALAPALAL
jgi:ribosomal protein S4E